VAPFVIPLRGLLWRHHDVSQAVKAVRATRGVLVDLFERLENVFKRLETYTDVPPAAAMQDMILKIMVEVLSVLAIVTKEIKQGTASEFALAIDLPSWLTHFQKNFWRDLREGLILRTHCVG
jgi:superfamily II DNA helicase RecQ